MQPFFTHSPITLLLQQKLESLSFQERWPIPILEESPEGILSVRHFPPIW